jgi:L1 cell adhesion molecule like protein
VFEVRAISGDTHLGGADFDQRLVSYVQESYEKKFGVAFPISNHKFHQRLRKACEKAKCELSGTQRVEIELDACGPNGEDFLMTISRAQFNEICDDLFRKCMTLVRQSLKDARLSASDVHDVVLVGGSTRVPKIQEMLSEEFGGKELCKSINPDEAVAYGAAIQAAVLAEAFKENSPSDTPSTVPDIVLLDVCPLSLGVETTGGLMSALIPRNTIVPVKRSRLYSTTEDNQETVSVNVFEGERANVSDNRKLGQFELSGIALLPRGAPKIRVSFELDADGIFTVTAEDESESTSLSTTIGEQAKRVLTIQNNKGRLSEAELKKYVADAEQNSIRDALFTKAIRLKTTFENLLFGVRRVFTETSAEILEEHADPENVKMVLDVVSDQFEWLQAVSDSDPLEELIAELERRSDWVENDVARSVVDAVNQRINEAAKL